MYCLVCLLFVSLYQKILRVLRKLNTTAYSKFTTYLRASWKASGSKSMTRIFCPCEEEFSERLPQNIVSKTGLREISAYLCARISTVGWSGSPTSKQTSAAILLSNIYALH